MSLLARFALAALLSLIVIPAASAVQPVGSAAWTDDGWTNVDSTLYTGPGPRYGEIGTVGAGLRIRVDRCSGIWCQVHAKNLKGWMALADISFGQYPWHLFDGRARFPVKYGGNVCFYSGASYTGTETCFSGGRVIGDLSLAGIDNSFSSVKIDGGSAMVCRDRNFRSYCVILNQSQTHLEGLLDNSISAIRVY